MIETMLPTDRVDALQQAIDRVWVDLDSLAERPIVNQWEALGLITRDALLLQQALSSADVSDRLYSACRLAATTIRFIADIGLPAHRREQEAEQLFNAHKKNPKPFRLIQNGDRFRPCSEWYGNLESAPVCTVLRLGADGPSANLEFVEFMAEDSTEIDKFYRRDYYGTKTVYIFENWDPKNGTEEPAPSHPKIITATPHE